MPKEYIEREALIDKIGTVPLWTGCREDSYTFELHLALVAIEKGLKKLISELPAADVVSVKHGEWIYDHWCEFKCSECGQLSDSKPYKGKERYCPNCGARMDGGK